MIRHRMLELTPEKQKPLESPEGLLPEDQMELLALQLGVDPELLEEELLLKRGKGPTPFQYQRPVDPPVPSGPGLLGGNPPGHRGPFDGGTVGPLSQALQVDEPALGGMDPVRLLMLMLASSGQQRQTRGRLGQYGAPSRSSFSTKINPSPGF